ncbi:MAG: glutamate synthase large subunit, partial [Acinetobacter radioresistens]
MPSPNTVAPAQGLYQPDEFKDNCGFGLIAHMQGEASHHLVETAIHSLSCMTHRGGIAADGKTGDGCGLLLAMPKQFFREEAQKLGVNLTEIFAAGTVFLNTDPALAHHAKQILNKEIEAEGLKVATWRVVPTKTEVLGEIALRSLPAFEQILVNCPMGVTEVEFNRKLFLARRRAEQQVNDPLFYVTTLATTVISYKGLMMPEAIADFYTDLADERLHSHIVVFHQRFSTNTLPRWPLAQPFRYLAHNGEINTITANRNWAMARTPKFENPLLPGLTEMTPIVNRTGSDSSSLDNMLEILVGGGMDLFRALRMLVPPAWQNVETLDADLRAFYEFNSKHMEAWDGPAGLVIQDGRHAICMLDRNGLRPARWVITKNGYITLASEIGVWGYEPEDVISKGRVGPGQILVIDTLTGKLLDTQDVNKHLKNMRPYRAWLRDHAIRLQGSPELEEHLCEKGLKNEQLKAAQKMFMVSFEERDQLLRPIAESGQEAVGSMGDDTPMAVLSRQVRHVSDYFRQQFAQVTNPPIDPLRESIVMSLETCLGREQNVFEQGPEHADRLIISSPVLSNSKMHQIRTLGRTGYEIAEIDLNYVAEEGLQAAIARICTESAQAIRDGKTILVLSDKKIREGYLPANAVMVTGAVHHYLIQAGLRTDANIVVESGFARDPHQFAVLLGFGATAIYPYLAYDVINDLIAKGELLGDPIHAQANFRKGIEKGLLKVLSKMGISTVASYRGGQLFEAVGLSSEVVDTCFVGVPSRIQGATFVDLENDQKKLADLAWKARKPIDQGGMLKFVFGKEYHAFNPDVINALHKAVRSGQYQDFKEYAQLVNQRPIATIRDLFKLKTDNPIALDQVESVESILTPFDYAGLSLGALYTEAHVANAVAKNNIGGRSNSGVGG